jgi:hypothetical protein
MVRKALALVDCGLLQVLLQAVSICVFHIRQVLSPNLRRCVIVVPDIMSAVLGLLPCDAHPS